jgi:hypothetical protein
MLAGFLCPREKGESHEVSETRGLISDRMM